MTNRDGARIESIDGLRGLAALSIVIYHNQHYFAATPIIGGAFLNVDLFFILSGYILTRIYEQDLQSGAIGFRRFIVNRMSRLWPLHVLGLALMLVVHLTLMRVMNFGAIEPYDDWVSFVANLGFMQTVSGLPGTTWNKPSWSVADEFIVNLIWAAAIVFGVWSLRIAIAAAAASLVVICVASYGIGSSGPFTLVNEMFHGINLGLVRTALGFCIGALIFHYAAPIARHIPFPVQTAACVVAIILVLQIIYLDTPQSVRIAIQILCVLMLFPLLVTMATMTPAYRLFSTWPIRALGAISYSMYMLHFPIGHAMTLLIAMGVDFVAPKVGAIYLCTVLLASTLSFFLVERPGQRLMRRILSTPQLARI